MLSCSILGIAEFSVKLAKKHNGSRLSQGKVNLTIDTMMSAWKSVFDPVIDHINTNGSIKAADFTMKLEDFVDNDNYSMSQIDSYSGRCFVISVKRPLALSESMSFKLGGVPPGIRPPSKA